MTSVQDSINALYFEAERNANDGKPMFAILHGAPADDPATTMLSGRPEDIYPVNFGVTSSRILRLGRVATRERFSKRFANIRDNRYHFCLQNQ